MTGLLLTFASAPSASPEPTSMGHPSDSASEAPRDTEERGRCGTMGVTAEQGCHLCGHTPMTWNFPAGLDSVPWAFLLLPLFDLERVLLLMYPVSCYTLVEVAFQQWITEVSYM
ncbi:unnamed protein product [Rangifer tarandus platyrhynchus]|uniref:Uncharacterized protein n=2 Tax=Rangifer tarandus platyrhynchus TaxID=3082113 RepID=A0AC59ZMT3_RANTA|nr:unnamed protein product [Rangifer tarandus platyrhynchus]